VRKNSNRIWTVVTFGIIGLSIWAVLNSQQLIDWWRLRGYEPTAAIARLAADTTLSDEGRKLFYVHDPELLDKQAFQGKCSVSEETIVLGCYISNTKIFVFNANEERLSGIEEVTTAHEVLHAAYDRLSENEKQRIDYLVAQAYESIDSERLAENVSSYRERDPTIVPNELHSIIGTEIRNLPQELEEYYAQYFLKRLDVVTLAEAYELEFTKLEDEIAAYDQRLETLQADIVTAENNLALLGASLQVEQAGLDSLQGNPEAFNNAVPSYNLKVRNYNNDLEALRAKIIDYNNLVKERNAITVEEQELLDAIDTRLPEL